MDSAYHDLVGQVRQKPVYQLYSPTPYYVDNSITVFLKDSIEETSKEAEKIFSAYPDLKILKIAQAAVKEFGGRRRRSRCKISHFRK